MIFITGDTHGEIDIAKLNSKNFPQGNDLTKNDYVIILGDFGFIWKNEPDKTEKYWMNWFKNKPWTTLFIDGNHDNFTRLNNHTVSEWHGGKVHKINDSVIHLMRGQIFNIDNKSIFAFGGAESYDKECRVDGISWWKEEIPNHAEIEEALTNLNNVNNKVDIMLTHTCPHAFSYELVHEISKDPTETILDEFYKTVKYQSWYFGHWHVSKCFDDKHTVLYNKVIEYK
jgi:predicted phosphodiesterase